MCLRGSASLPVLASKTSVTNSGTLGAVGESGSNSIGGTGGSGGGGGGVINLLGPSITAGTENVAGGPTGTNDDHSRFAGGGGGSGGGQSGATSAPTAGGTGLTFSKIASDPSTLLVASVQLQ
jgi:hypothetical protein